MNDIIQKIEAEGFYWAVARFGNRYSAYVTEECDDYIADTLAIGLCCHSADRPEEALRVAFEEEIKARAARVV